MLLHLLYSKPTHALLLNTLSHPHVKTLKLLKKRFVKTSLKPYMFRSLLYDHPQGSSFVLSALPLFRLFASSSCLFGMWLYVVRNVMFALENDSMVLFIKDMKELKHMTKTKKWTYLCVCVCLMYLSVGCLVMHCLLLRVGAARVHTTGLVCLPAVL
jgi:hypothetical protein